MIKVHIKCYEQAEKEINFKRRNEKKIYLKNYLWSCIDRKVGVQRKYAP